MRPFRLFLGALLILAAGAAFAGPGDECSCNTLESLQQEYQNAVYLEKFFRDLSGGLKDWETREAAKKAIGQGEPVRKASSSALGCLQVPTSIDTRSGPV